MKLDRIIYKGVYDLQESFNRYPSFLRKIELFVDTTNWFSGFVNFPSSSWKLYFDMFLDNFRTSVKNSKRITLKDIFIVKEEGV